MNASEQKQFSQTFLETTGALLNCHALLDNVDETLRQRCGVVGKRVKEHVQGNAPFRIAFCGVFSAGKSTLINTLLNSSYKLPTGVNPITTVVTRIQYGKELSCFYYYRGKRVSLDRQKTRDIIEGKTFLPEGCRDVTVLLPSEILRWNVEFLDTPGFDDDEIGGELETRTREALAEADFVVLCCSALQFGKILERELITELESVAGNFCMVVTRNDNLNTDEDAQDIARRAAWLMQGRGNLAMLPGSTGRFFLIKNGRTEFTLNGFDAYLTGITNSVEHKALIRSSTDMLSMISLVADLSYLSDETKRNIDLSAIRGAMPQQELQEKFVNGMLRMMKTAEKYCPQCGRKMEADQTICPLCGRVHQIKVREMNQDTKEKLTKISSLISRDNADYSICWSLEARKIAKIADQVRELTNVSQLPGLTEILQTDLAGLISHCRDAQFQIAIVGVMNAGKSMLMNALMGSEIASVDINAETASLTKFHSSDHFYLNITFHNSEDWDALVESANKSAGTRLARLLATAEVERLSRKWLNHAALNIRCKTVEELREQVAHWTSARSYDHLFAAEVEVGIDRSIFDMPDEIIFVDTPGLQDPVQYRSDITKAYIKKANAVLIAVPARALTAEGLETITKVLDYIGSKKEKAYIIATQKDLNNSRENEKVLQGWIEHLVDMRRYENEDEVRGHILLTSGKMHLLTEKFVRIEEDVLNAEMEMLDSGEVESTPHFLASDITDLEAYAKATLKKRLRFDIFSLREKPEYAKALIENSGIPALRDCISKNLLSQYKEIKMGDIRDTFIRCRFELLKIAEEARKTNTDILLGARGGTAELTKKLEKSTKAYETAKVKNREIREAAEAVRAFNQRLIDNL